MSGMRKISTRGRYGVKAMIELAMSYGEGVISAASLAQRQGISEPYLEQLMSLLKKGGLIEAVRGAFGGYTLSREPMSITVGEILCALEGDTAIAECVGRGGENSECKNTTSCSARPLWVRIQSSIDDILNTTTLADMVAEYTASVDNEGEDDE